METLLLNLTGNVRKETLNGRSYLVAPMVMLNPGVLNGSRGPLYYPMDEVVSNVDAWNGMPIVVNHPTINGKPVSARSPEVLEKFGVGYVFKATGKDKLAAEAWVDIEKAELVDNRIVDSLNAGIKLELSTGLYVDQEPAEEGATFNGVTPYTHVARNLRPDHLAILPDSIGACSLNDGCGVLVNKQCKCQTNEPNYKEPSMAKKELVDNLIANCSCWEDADRETLNALSEDKLKSLIEVGKPAEPQVVENQVETTFTDEEGNVHTWNTEKHHWETKKAEPKKEEPVENKEVKPQTESEWLESAPEGIRRAVQNAIAIESKQRAEIIESLTANLEGDAKTKLVSRLDALDLEALQDFQVLNTKKEEPKKNGSLASYFGQAGSPPSSSQGQPTVNQEDLLLDVPQINYKELSKSL